MNKLHLVASAAFGCACVALSGCAGPSGPPEVNGASGGDLAETHVEGPPRPGSALTRSPSLFISPAGEPFRGERGGVAPVGLWFGQADIDHDGRLTLSEFTSDYERFFRRIDTNGDGVVDGFEAQAYERGVAPELLPQVGRLRAGEGQDEELFRANHAPGSRRGGDKIGKGGRKGEPSGGAPSAAAFQLFPDREPLLAADTDFDGRVTIKEWRTRATAVFRQLDKTEAGFLSLAALPKTPQQAALEKAKPLR